MRAAAQPPLAARLRRTFASWLIAEREDAEDIVDQRGHADSKMTLDLYARALKSMRRRPHARRAEQALDEAVDVAMNGHARARTLAT